MLYRALTNFCGKISMSKNEEREISDKSLIKDLSEAKYIEPVKKSNTIIKTENENIEEVVETKKEKSTKKGE